MIDIQTHYGALLEAMAEGSLAPWGEQLSEQLRQVFADPHGDLPRWQGALASLPQFDAVTAKLDCDRIALSAGAPLAEAEDESLEQGLRALCPWRKGPFDFFGVEIDTEWRSDWKWQRVAPHLAPLENRLVLDVGCGSGYHMWRMLGEGAQRVVGVDPSLLFWHQFNAFKGYAGKELPIDLLPLRMEDVPAKLKAFDTVFSMGVLYHRKSPLEHLEELKGALRPGGQLVLETLVIDGPLGEVLMPEGRYAMMRNVWFIPSPETLLLWLRRLGFKNPRVVDLNQTSLDEQRATDWMAFNSLADFLDPNDRNKTAEGYPAPLRAVVLAEA